MNIVNVGYASTNYYVIGGASGRLLVDVGFPGTLQKLTTMLRQKDVATSQIGHLLVTHFHPDHAGLAEEVKSLGIRLIVVDCQLDAMRALPTGTWAGARFDGISDTGNVVVSFVESRELLRQIGIEGELVPTPGHSDDSVSLVTGNVACTGDLVAPSMAVDEASAALLRESWARLRALGVTRIYPGHGPAPRPLPADAAPPA